MKVITGFPVSNKSGNPVRYGGSAKTSCESLKPIACACFSTALLAICLSAISCTSARPAPPPAEVEDCGRVSIPTGVDVYHDMTKSMQGFLKAGSDSPYGEFLAAVERASIQSWNITPKLWKFGTIVEPMSDRNERFWRDQYEPKTGYVDNDYRVVVAHDSGQHVKVIVTDLIQSDNDIEGVSEAVLPRYFSTRSSNPEPVKNDASTNRVSDQQPKDLNPNKDSKQTSSLPRQAVGILGIKIPFQGPIFDFGRSKRRFSWNGDRAAYVLVLGSRASVVRYLASLNLELSKALPGRSIQSAILTPLLVNCLPRIDLLLPERMTGLDQVENLMTVQRHPLVKQFRIPRGATRAEFTLNVPLEITEQTPEPGLGDPLPRLHSMLARARGPDGFETADEAGDAVHAISTLRNEGKKPYLNLTVTIDPSRLAKDRIYRLEIAVGPDKEKMLLPRWVRQWSGGSDSDPDGSRTLNLDPFLSDLWNGMTSMQDPEMVHAYFYLRRD